MGIGLTLVLVRALTRSLDKLMVATEALSNGDLNGKISIDSKDELQALASSFNTMTERLKDSKEELQSAHDALEERVKERTRELRDANESLQKEIEEQRAYGTQVNPCSTSHSAGRDVGGNGPQFEQYSDGNCCSGAASGNAN